MNKTSDFVGGAACSLHDVESRPVVIIFDSQELRAEAREKRRRKYFKNSTKLCVNALVFVNSSGLNRKDEETRRTIRSHVQRRYRQGQKRGLTDQVSMSGSKNSSKTSVDPSEPRGRFSFYSQVGSSLDPFTIYPIHMQPDTYMLVHRYVNVISRTAYPKEVVIVGGSSRSVLFELALTDAALFHMLLCSSALYIDVADGKTESPVALHHKIMAIRHINSKLRNMQVSDAIIGAVTYLAKVESVLENILSWHIHMNGLIKMVASRGGLMNLPAMLREKICMADLSGCLQLDLAPRLSTVHDTFAHRIKAVKLHRPSLCAGFQTLTSMYGLDDELTFILHDVKTLTDQVGFIKTAHMAPGSENVDHTAATLRRQLLSSRLGRKLSTRSQIIIECCRLSSLIHLRIILHAFPRRASRGGDVLLDKLKHCIELVDDWNIPDTEDLSVWMYFICSIACVSSQQRRRYVGGLSAVSRGYPIATSIELKIRLRKFFWVDVIYERLADELWREICLA